MNGGMDMNFSADFSADPRDPPLSSASAIVLLRHGETEGGTDADGGAVFRGSRDDLLTAGGWRQMASSLSVFEREAEKAENIRADREGGESGTRLWNEIVSSPLLRCRLFAERYARRCGVPLRFDARLAEMDFGAWEGMSVAALMRRDGEALARFWRDPAACPPPWGEPLPRFVARVREAWEELAARCHGGETDQAMRAEARGKAAAGEDEWDERGERRGGILVVTHGGPIRVILCLSEDALAPERLSGADLLRHEVGHGSLHRLRRTPGGGWRRTGAAARAVPENDEGIFS